MRLLVGGVALLGLIWIWNNESADTMDGVPHSTKSEIHTQDHQNQKPSPKEPKEKESRKPSSEESTIPYFSFEKESEKLQELVAQWPQSREKLISLIEQADPYEKQGVEPHTLSEIQQRQWGALKVMALREMMAQQKDRGQLAMDLRRIAQRAQDPTIQRIARASEDSLGRGRSFFDDFLEGVKRLPL